MAKENTKVPGIEKVSYSVDKEQLMLKSSYEMYERSIKETEEHMMNEIDKDSGERTYTDDEVKDRINLLKEAEKDIVDKFIQNGGTMEELTENTASKTKKKVRKRAKAELDASILDKVAELTKEKETKVNKEREIDEIVEENAKKSSSIKVKDQKDKVLSCFIPKVHNYAGQASFDIIPLPSKGECYKDKIDKLPVSYLTAYDENIIISPNLYKENLVLDYILSEKIMNDEIDPSLLLDGDRDAIILYLRAAGYGNEYPINVTDDRTGVEFTTIVDLSELKFKEFNLVGDEDGYFEYKLPVSNNVIKFKFLNHQENKVLQELNVAERRNGYKERISTLSGELERMLDDQKNLEPQMKIKARESIKGINEWAKSLKETDGDEFTHILTNKLELSIMSIDGNKDRKFIRNFVRNMNVRDSIKLRKYITDNEPGVDFNMTVQRPESLGGGSMNVFLELDQFVFLNIPE